MSSEQRRAEGIAAINAEIARWATEPDSVVYPFHMTNLAERLFDLQPAYCPHDCSGCHDDECPCSNCAPRCCHPDQCKAPAHPCCDNCPRAEAG